MKLIKKYIYPLIVLVFSLIAVRSLLSSDYFIMHDDLQMMRQLEMEKCILDHQIPCRWVPDMGYGFGFPLFNYYPPLPYILGEAFRVLGFSFVVVAKLTFALSILLSALTMYLLAKEFLGTAGAAISSIFYVWAPYHAVDVFVRGAMNESWALVWFPLILLTSYKLIKGKELRGKWVAYLGISWSLLLLSHNVMVMIFVPVFAIWLIIHMISHKDWKVVLPISISGMLALGLSAFFTLPVVFEQRFVQIKTLVSGYYQYYAHFASIYQLLVSRFWGDGPSTFGPNDGMPFPVGHIHWILSLVVIMALALFVMKRKETLKKKDLVLPVFFFAVGWASVFMAHSRSSFIWEIVPPLAFVQFPWRFLTLSMFGLSFVAGSVFLIVKKKWHLALCLILGVAVTIWNFTFFKPVRSGPLTDEGKFSGEAWRLQQQAGIYDYLPVTAKVAPQEQKRADIEVVEGEVNFFDKNTGTDWMNFRAEVESDASTLRISILKFPGWKSYVNGIEIPNYVPDTEDWGRMYIDVPKGSHDVSIKLTDTPVRVIGNWISLASWVGILTYLLLSQKMLKSKRG